MLQSIVAWILDEPKPPSKLLHLQWMDRLDKLEKELSKKIYLTKGKAEQRYWMDKWEECVHLYMEYEWELHPDNEDSMFRTGD